MVPPSFETLRHQIRGKLRKSKKQKTCKCVGIHEKHENMKITETQEIYGTLLIFLRYDGNLREPSSQPKIEQTFLIGAAGRIVRSSQVLELYDTRVTKDIENA